MQSLNNLEIMELKKSLYIKVNQNIQEAKEKIHKKDYNFFQVELLLDLAKLTQKFSKDCKHCDANKKELEEISKNISININTISGRQKHTDKIDKITSHLSKTHKIYYRGYFLSIYSLLGMLAGTISGVLIVLPISVHITAFGGMAGFTIGLIVGRILGRQKEKKLELNNQFLKK